MINPTLLEDPSSVVVAASERCRYPSKFCRHRRSLKRNGELHRFCDHHRTKANLNQKRWSKSRRGGGSAVPTTPTRDENDSDSSHASWATVVDALAQDEEDNEAEMKKLVDAPSFTSMLSMLQPVTGAEALHKPEIAADEQLGALLRELLHPLEQACAPQGGDRVLNSYVLQDQYAMFVEL